MRALAFSSTTAWVTSADWPASCIAFWRSASEMKGTPAASSVLA